ncbi:MAG: N-acetyltransferase [Ferruginibacter sp.]
MKIIQKFSLTAEQKEGVRALWNQEYPEKLRHNNLSDLENYLQNLEDQEHFLLTDAEGKLSGWAFTFSREDERWFAIILGNNIHGLGFGRSLLNKLKEKDPKLNGWVIDHDSNQKRNGQFYKSPLDFYLKNNFEVIQDTRLETDNISAVKIEWVK